jgi:hypothetical protein
LDGVQVVLEKAAAADCHNRVTHPHMPPPLFAKGDCMHLRPGWYFEATRALARERFGFLFWQNTHTHVRELLLHVSLGECIKAGGRNKRNSFAVPVEQKKKTTSQAKRHVVAPEKGLLAREKLYTLTDQHLL